MGQESLAWNGATILSWLRLLEGLTHNKLVHSLVNEHLNFYIDNMIISCTSFSSKIIKFAYSNTQN